MENGNCKNSNGKLVPKKGELWCVVWVWVGKLQVVCWTTLGKVKWKSAQMRRLCELPDFGASWVQFCSICTSRMSPLIYVETKRNNTTCSMNHALNWRNNPKHIQYLVWQSILKLRSNSNKMSVNQGTCQGALLLNIFCLSLRHLNVSSEDASDLFRSNLPTQPASSGKIQEIWWPKRLSGGFVFLGPELLTWDGGLMSANLRPNMMPTIYHHWIKIVYIYISSNTMLTSLSMNKVVACIGQIQSSHVQEMLVPTNRRLASQSNFWRHDLCLYYLTFLQGQCTPCRDKDCRKQCDQSSCTAPSLAKKKKSASDLTPLVLCMNHQSKSSGKRGWTNTLSLQ